MCGEHGCAPSLALDGHRLTTFRVVVAVLVLRAVDEFVVGLRRRFGGCLESDGGARARRLALEITRGATRGRVRQTCHTPGCVSPAHLEVAS